MKKHCTLRIIAIPKDLPEEIRGILEALVGQTMHFTADITAKDECLDMGVEEVVRALNMRGAKKRSVKKFTTWAEGESIVVLCFLPDCYDLFSYPFLPPIRRLRMKVLNCEHIRRRLDYIPGRAWR